MHRICHVSRINKMKIPIQLNYPYTGSDKSFQQENNRSPLLIYFARPRVLRHCLKSSGIFAVTDTIFCV